MISTCPDCEYARAERAGFLMCEGVEMHRADSLAASERCARCVDGSTESRPTVQPSGLKITVVRWERHVKQKGEFVGGGRTLAGPYRFGFDGNREQVVGLYRRWLNGEIQGRTLVFGKLKSLLAQAGAKEGLTLVCMDVEIGEVIESALRYIDERNF